MSHYIGIDYSITSPAICIYEGKPEKFAFKSCRLYSLNDHNVPDNKEHHLYFKKHKDYKNLTERFRNIAKWALDVISDDSSATQETLLGLEGYAMGAKGQVFNIGENTGILKLRLYDNGYIPEIIPPTVIKKFATGKGAGKKDKMYEQFVQDTGINLKEILQPNRKLGSPTTDLIDAYYICAYMVKGERQ